MSTAVDRASQQTLDELRVKLTPLLLRQMDGRGSGVHLSTRRLVLCLAWYSLQDSITSLNALDQDLRKPDVQQTLGLSSFQCSENAPIASDSTIRQALDGWPQERIRAVSDWLYLRLRKKGLLTRTLPSGRTLSVGVVDSSSFGDCYSNCITAATDSGSYPLDLEAHDEFKRGKELPAARRMLQRWNHRFELLLFDGLYLTQWVVEDLDGPDTADALIKYPIRESRDKSLPWPLDQAQYRIQKGLRSTHTLQDDTGDTPVTCHRVSIRTRGQDLVIDRFQDPREDTDDFFTVSTRRDLSVEDTGQLARERFGSIENQGFRALSLQNDSKDQRPKGGPTLPDPVKYTLLFWLLLFQSIFRMMAELVISEDELQKVKVTQRWIYDCLETYIEALFNKPRGDPG